MSMKRPPGPLRWTWLPRRGVWGSVPTTGGHRAQGEGLPATLASTALRENVGVGNPGSVAWVDKRQSAPIAVGLDCCGCQDR